jgi:hypothetical protein
LEHCLKFWQTFKIPKICSNLRRLISSFQQSYPPISWIFPGQRELLQQAQLFDYTLRAGEQRSFCCCRDKPLASSPSCCLLLRGVPVGALAGPARGASGGVPIGRQSGSKTRLHQLPDFLIECGVVRPTGRWQHVHLPFCAPGGTHYKRSAATPDLPGCGSPMPRRQSWHGQQRGCVQRFRLFGQLPGRNKLKGPGSRLLVSPFPRNQIHRVLLRGAVKLVGSRRPVGKLGETHGVFPGLSIGDRTCAVRRGSAQPTVHKFTAPARHGVRRPAPSLPLIGRGKPRPVFAS